MKKAIIVICLMMLIAGCVAVAGCGSGGGNEKSVKSTVPEDSAEKSESDGSDSGLEGTYVLEVNGAFIANVTLKADNEATYSLTEDGGIPVTYKVNGDTVVLIGLDGQEIPSATFKITDEGLVDSTGGLYKKQ